MKSSDFEIRLCDSSESVDEEFDEIFRFVTSYLTVKEPSRLLVLNLALSLVSSMAEIADTENDKKLVLDYMAIAIEKLKIEMGVIEH